MNRHEVNDLALDMVMGELNDGAPVTYEPEGGDPYELAEAIFDIEPTYDEDGAVIGTEPRLKVRRSDLEAWPPSPAGDAFVVTDTDRPERAGRYRVRRYENPDNGAVHIYGRRVAS